MADGNLLVGTRPDQVPANGQLGDLAYQSADGAAFTGPVGMRSYLLAALPPVPQMVPGDRTAMIVVTNATGGAALCVSDGVNWINTRTGAVVA